MFADPFVLLELNFGSAVYFCTFNVNNCYSSFHVTKRPTFDKGRLERAHLGCLDAANHRSLDWSCLKQLFWKASYGSPPEDTMHHIII